MQTILIDFDLSKAQSNFDKHGIAFDEAATCLLDARALVREDQNAEGEVRIVLLGCSEKGRLLTVVYTLRGETPRLISARKATKNETKSYET